MSDSVKETLSNLFSGKKTLPEQRSLLDGELCGCGCGEPAVEGVEMHAVLLAICRESLKDLRNKAKSGGERSRKAEHLFWAWSRCEEAFENYVHGYLMWECGPPTYMWINSWRKRVEEL